MPTENRSSNTEQMIPCDDGLHLIQLDENLSHYGWVFRKVEGGWPYSVRKATEHEMAHAKARQHLRAGAAQIAVQYQPATQFDGDNATLISSINSLLALDAKGALVPNGVCGLARQLLEASTIRLAAQHQGEPVGEVVAFGESLHEIAWAQGKLPRLGTKLYTSPSTSDGFSAGDMADQGAKAFREGVAASADFIQKRMDDYLSEFGAIDPETGSVELPRGGDEYVGELQEIIEAVRALPLPQ